MRNLILYVATSLDGYLADAQGGMDWLTQSQADQQEAQESIMEGYLSFYQTVDTVLMGRTTYDQIVTELSPDFWPYQEKKTYVFTHQPQEDAEGITFTNRSPEELIRWLTHRKGGDIWLCGGANLVAQCLEANLIHQYHLSIQPILLGEGIPLFPQQGTPKNLKLISTKQNQNTLEVVYHRI